ncbi:hypothetical protein ACJX0J_012617 [Zea mays]
MVIIWTKAQEDGGAAGTSSIATHLQAAEGEGTQYGDQMSGLIRRVIYILIVVHMFFFFAGQEHLEDPNISGWRSGITSVVQDD